MVVMKKLKLSFQGMTLSPILIISCPPCLNFCWRSKVSRDASRASPTFSSRTHLPKRTPFSRVRRKFLSESLITSRPFSANLVCLPMFLMNLFAWPCGSMKSE